MYNEYKMTEMLVEYLLHLSSIIKYSLVQYPWHMEMAIMTSIFVY